VFLLACALYPPNELIQSVPILRSISAYIAKTALKARKCGGHSWFCTSTMPPDRYSSQDAFNVDMLDPRVLNAPDGLVAVVRAFGAVCHRDHADIAEMVAALNGRSYILEYIISGTLHALVRY
jgi:hypothetical protein